jgi:peptidoglycan-associated lipoprotein
MKKTALLIFGILLVNLLSAQTPLQKADSIYKNKDYYNAIQLYNKALKKATGEESKYIYYQLGECCRNYNSYVEAQAWYQKAITAGSTIPDVNLHMGEMLIMSGEYADAKTYIEKYIKEVPTDNLAKLRLESCNLGLKGQKEKPLFEVKDQKDLSSISSDYSIAYFKNNKVIISSARMEGSSKYDPSTTQGFSDLYESTYDPQKGLYSKPTKVKGSINTGFNEGTFSFDAATNYAYYSQCNGASGKLKQCNIMYAYYNETANTWENSTLFDYNSQTFRIQQPALSADGKSIYFASDMPGGFGGADIYVIKKVNGVWGQPENLGATINTIGNEGFPFISGDSLLVFASDGLSGLGGLDIFESSIKNGNYSKPVNMLSPINSSADDFNLVFKDNKNEGFFCSNRIGGVGDDDIYTYEKIPVIITASGNIKDKATSKNLENAVAVFKGSDGSVDSVFTDSKGNYEFAKCKANVKYSIKASKVGYLNDSKNLTIGNDIYSKSYNKTTGYDIDFALIQITKEEVKIDNIYYDYDKADLREDSKIELNKLVNILKETPDVKLQINSHSDERGEAKYNTDLSQRRAQSVVDYLIANGISSDRLIAKGYGFSMPLVKNAKTEEQHQMNRRTTFKILNSTEIGKSGSYNYTTPVKTDVQTSGTATTVTTTTGNVAANSTSTSGSVSTTVSSGTTTATGNVSTNSSPNSTTTTATNATTTTSTTSNTFFIIAGSYPSQAKAEEAVAVLKKTGYTNAVVVGLAPNGNYRIAYAGFATKAEATTELAKIKLANSSAWLFEKK